jgi:hypothetical protein
VWRLGRVCGEVGHQGILSTKREHGQGFFPASGISSGACPVEQRVARGGRQQVRPSASMAADLGRSQAFRSRGLKLVLLHTGVDGWPERFSGFTTWFHFRRGLGNGEEASAKVRSAPIAAVQSSGAAPRKWPSRLRTSSAAMGGEKSSLSGVRACAESRHWIASAVDPVWPEAAVTAAATLTGSPPYASGDYSEAGFLSLLA